ncbi:MULTISPECIES: hypothetical protein [Rhizobium/Agrobacterium group]|uniref:Uncharacterized protein n=1 Tax=Agrobacterium arsenijevicii TaxID=1585697 RepID=A0ABR5D608_9HYPH|nr:MULTISPECIES: hypothetical protein [unclassified Rhizobium]KJF72506.1 hypothetical protein RP75_15355 [Agrobacterium arsenijevicii]MDH7803569.1 hypothetical protein [Rhizobium sp. AN70]
MQEKKARIISGGNRIVGRGRDVCLHEELPGHFYRRLGDFAGVVDKVEWRVIAWHRKAQDREPLSLLTDVSEWNEWQPR